MSSRLLNVLNKIESDRKELVNFAHTQGYNSISNNAQFRDLQAAMPPVPEQGEIPTYNIPQDLIMKQDWERPLEGPDCYNILMNTESVGNDNPFCILLLKDDSDTTIIPKRNSPPSYPGVGDYLTYTRVLTSDGVNYTNVSVDIEHTGDKSKDIIVPSGEYAGTYRYLILYYTKNNSTSGGLLSSLPVVEIIHNGSLWTSSASPSPIMFLFNTAAQNIINIEIYGLGNSPTTTFSDRYGDRFALCDLPNLRHFKFIPTNGIRHKIYVSNFNGSLFRNCPKLRHIDLSMLDYVCSSSTTPKYRWSFNGENNYSLVSIKLPKTTRSSTNYRWNHYVKLGYNPQLQLISHDCDNEAQLLELEGGTMYNTFCPKSIRTEGECVYWVHNVPSNWNGHSYISCKRYYTDDSLYTSAASSNVPTLDIANYKWDIIDLSNCLCYTNINGNYGVGNNNSNYSTISYSGSGPTLYYTGFINMPNSIALRLNFNPVSLTKENIIDILTKLKDLTDIENVYNPIIRFNVNDKRKLNNEEGQIAIDKGGEVLFV